MAGRATDALALLRTLGMRLRERDRERERKRSKMRPIIVATLKMRLRIFFTTICTQLMRRIDIVVIPA